MSSEQLTAILAERVLGWRACPDRFVTGNRSWIPRSRFQPTERIQDAIRLLLAVQPAAYSIGAGKGTLSWAKVLIGGVSGEASARSIPMAICLATAKTMGVDVGEIG